MKTNTDTGEAVLSDVELIEASIAEDGVDTLKSVLDDLSLVMARIQRLKDNHTIKVGQDGLVEFQNIVCDATVDLLTRDWTRLAHDSYSADYSTHLPDLHGIRALRVPTNPATYSSQGNEL